MRRSDRELLKDALDALEEIRSVDTADYWDLMEEIRDRLAEPEEEPYTYAFEVGVKNTDKKVAITLDEPRFPVGVVCDSPIFPLYHHPPRQPVRLSDEEIESVCQVWRCSGVSLTELVRDMESAFIEKNQ